MKESILLTIGFLLSNHYQQGNAPSKLCDSIPTSPDIQKLATETVLKQAKLIAEELTHSPKVKHSNNSIVFFAKRNQSLFDDIKLFV